MKNILVKGTVEGVRIYALCTTELVQELNLIHGNCSHYAVFSFRDIDCLGGC